MYQPRHIREASPWTEERTDTDNLGRWEKARLKILALDALAVVGAEDGGLEALAVFLEAPALLAVAPLVVTCCSPLDCNMRSLLHSALYTQARHSHHHHNDSIFVWDTLIIHDELSESLAWWKAPNSTLYRSMLNTCLACTKAAHMKEASS